MVSGSAPGQHNGADASPPLPLSVVSATRSNLPYSTPLTSLYTPIWLHGVHYAPFLPAFLAQE